MRLVERVRLANALWQVLQEAYTQDTLQWGMSDKQKICSWEYAELRILGSYRRWLIKKL